MGKTQVLCFGLITFFAPIAVGAPCTKQDYNSHIEPDYECPGPGEEIIPQLPDAAPTVPQNPNDPNSPLVLDKKRVINLGIRIQGLRRLRWIEFTRARLELENELRFYTLSAEADVNLANKQVENYKTQVVFLRNELEKERAWYKTWTFGFVLGLVVVASGTTALAISLD